MTRAETAASVLNRRLRAGLLLLAQAAYADPAAANSAAGLGSPNVQARKRPSIDAGAFSLPTASTLGERDAQPALWRAARGSRKARRTCARSSYPASSVTSLGSGVADSYLAQETTAMRRNIDPVEDAYLRSEAERLRTLDPLYRLSFFTCDDHSDAKFIAPRLPAGTLRRDRYRASLKLGERMAQELCEAIADDGPRKFSTASFVIAIVLQRCRDAVVLRGFGMGLGDALVGCADMLHFHLLDRRKGVAFQHPLVTPSVTRSDPRNGPAVTASAKDGSLSRPRRAA